MYDPNEGLNWGAILDSDFDLAGFRSDFELILVDCLPVRMHGPGMAWDGLFTSVANVMYARIF